jgi:hypothetical protein
MPKKKSFRKMPSTIKRRLAGLKCRPFVIGAVVEVPFGDELPNLPGVVSAQDADAPPALVLPDPRRGTWAGRNVEGWEIVRKDLPMTKKTFSHESPNFGDWSKGSHEVSFTRDVYQREFFPGYGTPIKVRELRRGPSSLTFALELDRVFDSIPGDERELLFALNVFHEAVGESSLHATDEAPQSFIRSLRVDWELLPPGERDLVLAEVRRRLKPSEDEDRVLVDRFDLLEGLRPLAFITGSSHFARYFGAKFSDQLVVFENLRYGNAIYIMFENWEELSKLSRTDLMKTRTDFERIIHRSGWKRRVRTIVREYRQRGRP